MTKDDLRTGMVVRTRNDKYYMVMLEFKHKYNENATLLVSIVESGYLDLDEYCYDLTLDDKTNLEWSIDEVYEVEEISSIFKEDYNILDNLDLIWTRESELSTLEMMEKIKENENKINELKKQLKEMENKNRTT